MIKSLKAEPGGHVQSLQLQGVCEQEMEGSKCYFLSGTGPVLILSTDL